MNIEYKQIRSSASPDDSMPWYELSVSDGVLTVDDDGDGGHNPDQTGESIAIDTSANSFVAVEQGGGLITRLLSDEDVPPLRAHLAWYDAATDTVTVLDFVES